MRDEAPKPRFSRREMVLLTILFSATFVVATGIQMGNALFPALSRLLDVPVSTVTLLVSVWAFTGLLAPLFGPPSDRYGHGTFVLIGLASFILGNLLCAFAPGFTLLQAFQVFVGLGYAIFNFSASAVVGDLFAYEVRARAMSFVRVAVSVTALVGVPAAAALAGWATARASFGAVGGLGLLVLLFAWRVLPRSPQRGGRTPPAEVKATLWRAVQEVTRQRSALAGLFTLAVWAMIPTGVFVYLAAWLEQTFRLSEAQVGLVFALVGVGGLIGNGLTAAWADRVGKKRSALLGLVALSAAAMLLPHLLAPAAALACITLLAVALEFCTASFGTLMTELAPASRGTLLSLVSLAIGVGTGLAPLLLRPLWESGGYGLVTLVLGAVGLVLTIVAGILIAEPQAPVPDQAAYAREASDGA
jgi:predicted MFS family arabinose efflux permease